MVSYYTAVFGAAIVITTIATLYARNLNGQSNKVRRLTVPRSAQDELATQNAFLRSAPPFRKQVGTSPAFKRFQLQYLGVYYCMMAGDWLQGPYVYALYDSYGFSQEDIAVTNQFGRMGVVLWRGRGSL